MSGTGLCVLQFLGGGGLDRRLGGYSPRKSPPWRRHWCCVIKFLHALETDQGLLAHSPGGTGVPQKVLIVKIKIWPKIQGVRVNTFRATGSILTKHFQATCHGAGDNVRRPTIFGRPARKKFGRAKKSSKIWRDFRNFRLWSRISPERIKISKIGKSLDHLQPLPRWMKKFGVYFCQQTKKLFTL